jgi:iron(II)-dependent oxidoreductase
VDANRNALARRLKQVRRRTLALVAPLADDDLRRQVDPIVSPVLWDLLHVANFEERWTHRRLNGGEPLADPIVDQMLDPEVTPRRGRGALDLPSREAAMSYLERAHAAAMDALTFTPLRRGADPVALGGYAFELVAQHEEQHQETILQTLALMEPGRYVPPRATVRPSSILPPRGSAVIPEGPFVMGAGDDAFAYDNERPAHVLSLPAFSIDAAPVSEAEYLEFVAAGGYVNEALWTDEGRDWLRSSGASAPLGWERRGRQFVVTAFERESPPDPGLPVVRVSWFEASAYARWRRKRLPTEAEWEKAASWDPIVGKSRFPWGDAPWDHERADLDQLAFGPRPLGSFARGATPRGVLGLLGSVWEWTAGDFVPYEGFQAFPYDGYSKAHFERGMKVLRGGSWATRPAVARTTFRNWDFPERRQIFAGIRCASDA